MNYIEDIETYLFVINSNKKEIFEKYEELRKKPFEMGAGLKLFKHKEDKANNDNSNNDNGGQDEDQQYEAVDDGGDEDDDAAYDYVPIEEDGGDVEEEVIYYDEDTYDEVVG